MAALPPLQKGLDGRYLCRWCQGPVQPPRRMWCSEACVNDYNLRSNPGYARIKTFERDKGVCAICKIDTETLFGLTDPDYLAAVKAFKGYDAESDRLLNEWYETKDQGCWDALEARRSGWMTRHNLSVAVRNLGSKLREVREKELIAAGWTKSRVLGGSLWDMDHIKPVIEGGGECGMDNLRTLCIKCHKAETAALRKRMKEAKANGPQEV